MVVFDWAELLSMLLTKKETKTTVICSLLISSRLGKALTALQACFWGKKEKAKISAGENTDLLTDCFHHLACLLGNIRLESLVDFSHGISFLSHES